MPTFNSWTGVDSPTLDSQYAAVTGVTTAAEFAAALVTVAAAGGGVIAMKPGTYTFTSAQTYDPTDGPVTIIAYGCLLNFTGSGVAMTFDSSGGGGSGIYGCNIFGGRWIGDGTPTHGIRIQDASRTALRDMDISGFTTTAVELRNDASYCEQTLISNCRITAGDNGLLFTPASISGGGGTESFARTHVRDTIIAGGTAGEYLILCRGGVYASSFTGIGGNLTADAHVFYLSGAMGGTKIDSIGYEFGSASSVGFTSGTFTGSAPYIGTAIDFRSPITFASGDTTPSRKSTYFGRLGASDLLFATEGGATNPLGAMTGVYLSGASGVYVSTPDAAALDIVGDIDVRAWIAPDDVTPSASMTFASKYTSTSSQRSWRFYLTTTGTLAFRWSPDGSAGLETAGNSTAAIPSSNGEGIWVRATVDVDNGASGYDLKYWTSTDGSQWTQLGTTIVGGATTSIFNSSAALTVSGYNAGTLDTFTGAVMRMQVRDGIDGTLVADYRATSPMSPYRDSTGKAWTLNGAVSWVVAPIDLA